MKFCKICNTTTTHTKGTFKCRNIEDELFILETSTDEALKNLSAGFNQFTQTDSELINSQSPVDYIKSENGELNLNDLFAKSIRAFKCTECGHLIQLSKFP